MSSIFLNIFFQEKINDPIKAINGINTDKNKTIKEKFQLILAFNKKYEIKIKNNPIRK